MSRVDLCEYVVNPWCDSFAPVCLVEIPEGADDWFTLPKFNKVHERVEDVTIWGVCNGSPVV